MGDPFTRPGRTGGAVDARTVIAPPVSRPLPPREAFLAAHERLSVLSAVPREPAVVVVAVDARARVVESLCLGARDAVVIGRHQRCTLRLEAETVSLRHAAALLLPEGDRLLLRVWDLGTGAPLVTEDGQRAGAVVAEGPLYLAIDSYALWFVPASAALRLPAAAAWEAMPAREILDRRAPDLRPVADPPRILPEGTHTTRITRLGAPLLIGDGEEPEVGWGELKVGVAGRRERRRVSAERLEQGVLIGRYERCGVGVAGSARLSRVHLLLVRIGGDLWAIDTASTNGVRRGDRRVEAVVLDDTDRLALGDEVSVEWRRAALAEA